MCVRCAQKECLTSQWFAFFQYWRSEFSDAQGSVSGDDRLSVECWWGGFDLLRGWNSLSTAVLAPTRPHSWRPSSYRNYSVCLLKHFVELWLTFLQLYLWLWYLSAGYGWYAYEITPETYIVPCPHVSPLWCRIQDFNWVVTDRMTCFRWERRW